MPSPNFPQVGNPVEMKRRNHEHKQSSGKFSLENNLCFICHRCHFNLLLPRLYYAKRSHIFLSVLFQTTFSCAQTQWIQGFRKPFGIPLKRHLISSSSSAMSKCFENRLLPNPCAYWVPRVVTTIYTYPEYTPVSAPIGSVVQTLEFCSDTLMWVLIQCRQCWLIPIYLTSHLTFELSLASLVPHVFPWCLSLWFRNTPRNP